MAAGSATLFLLFCSLCGFAFLSRNHVSGLSFFKEDVKKWAEDVGKEAFKFANETGAGALQKDYEKQNLTVEPVMWKDVLSETKSGMDDFFERKAEALRKLVKKAEEAYCEHNFNKDLELRDIDYPNSKKLDKYLNDTELSLEESVIFNNKISFNRSTVHVPTDVYDGATEIVNGISWTKYLDEVFVDNWEEADNHSLAWQYFGSDKGFLRTYPASAWVPTEQEQVDLYDARRRPWYIHGATSPKDVVILIDASGSMHGVPMRIAKLSAQAMIDTLDDNDFFNIVYFNTKAVVLCCEESGKLLQASKKNKIYAKEKLKEIEDSEVANWEVGMKKAFTLLEQARNCSMCQQAIMVFSDGGTASLTETFKEHNSNKKVRVFTYPVGPPAESTVAMRRMACGNRGYFTRIQSIGAVREVSENYVRVMTRPNAMKSKENGTEMAVWTSVYLDALGLGMMVTATMPAFYRDSDATNCDMTGKDENSHLLGVMGIDVPLNFLRKYELPPLIGPSGYIFAIDNNGKIVLHPRLKTVAYSNQENKELGQFFGYLPDPPGVDLMDIELPVNSSALAKLREEMIKRTPASVEPVKSEGHTALELYDLSPDELRVVRRNMNFYYAGFKGTSFSLAIATPKLGFRYVRYGGNPTMDSILGNLSTLLNESGVNIEKWPYCRSVTFAEDPVNELKARASGSDWKDCNQDLLYGLLVDLRATSTMKDKWDNRNAVKDVFTLTFWGLTRRKESSDRIDAFSYHDVYSRVAASADDIITYVAPVVSAKNEANNSVVFAFQKVSLKGQPVAVVGYEMDAKKFSDMRLGEKTDGECSSRDGMNSHEGQYCYLLDENGFVVAANDERSFGKFFGRVDKYLMKELINETASDPSTAIYNRIIFSDTQAACAERSLDNSAGTIISGPIFSVRSYFEWWTTKAAWSLLYFNLYSFFFSGTSSYTEAAENISKNRSCVKEVTTYYVNRSSVNENGTADCDDACRRVFLVSNVPHSNLFLVVVDGTCGMCKDEDFSLKMAGEPVVVPATSTKESGRCEDSSFRKRPKRCFTNIDPEEGYDCGAGSILTPSLLLILVHVFCFALVTWPVEAR